jgi:Na+/H+ antiporter NhaD/arsenite permease-like protein
VNGLLLAIYFIMESHHYKKESAETKENTVEKHPMSVFGKLNFLWLLCIIFAVAFLNPNMLPFMDESPFFGFIRDGAILLAAGLSLITTKREVRTKNEFS